MKINHYFLKKQQNWYENLLNSRGLKKIGGLNTYFPWIMLDLGKKNHQLFRLVRNVFNFRWG